jgi:hypothetical protein
VQPRHASRPSPSVRRPLLRYHPCSTPEPTVRTGGAVATESCRNMLGGFAVSAILTPRKSFNRLSSNLILASSANICLTRLNSSSDRSLYLHWDLQATGSGLMEESRQENPDVVSAQPGTPPTQGSPASDNSDVTHATGKVKGHTFWPTQQISRLHFLTCYFRSTVT